MVERADSIIVDISDPSAAMAAAAAEMMVSLVRRAKSTREPRRPRRSPSTAAPEQLQRPRSLDLPSHPAVRPIPQRRATVKEEETHGKDQLAAPVTGLKKRPSLRDRLKSLRGRPAPIMPSTMEEPAPKTPTDAHFVLRPKRGALDLTGVAGALQVPRDSEDNTAPAVPLQRSSTEKTSRSLPTEERSERREHRPVVLVDAPYPSPPLSSPREKGECTRCHSKRVQREHSVHKLTGELPPRIAVHGSPSLEEKRTDPLDDYTLFTRSAATDKHSEANAYSGGGLGLLQPADSYSDSSKKGHTKAAPSWASYHDGDSDEEKIQAHRKSTLQPLIAIDQSKNGVGYTQPPGMKRQRSVAQRIVDKFRPSRTRSVKPVQRVLTA